ncbi:putative methyltransferase PMT13 [Vitis vinifera]|uniref:Putative methyltransferase PMT13 n=1 Tax=Vitis vinifera TaxID=29760 RepID=A0A438DB01_VITVI|nr:putative methyltransferase PMT13 [Vitis vinifera]
MQQGRIWAWWGKQLGYKLGEGEVQSREEKLRKCLVGSFGKGPLSTSESFTLRKWATITWSLKQRLKVSVFKGFFLLFDFKDCMEAERVFARGSRRLKERILQLARWKPEIGWCGEERKFVTVDEDMTDLNQLRWARILVKLDGRAFPASLQVVIGSPSFSIQLWCEIPPKFSKVILRSCNSGSQDLEIWGDKAGGSCTGKGVRKEMHPLQIDGVDVLTLSGRRVYFGESAAFCISKATAGGKGNGGCGRVTSEGGRDGLEENVVRSFWRGGLLSGGVGSSEDFVSEKRSSEMFWTGFIDKALQAEEVEASFCPFRMIMPDGSSMVCSFGVFRSFLGMSTKGYEEEILALLKKLKMRKDQKTQLVGTKRSKLGLQGVYGPTNRRFREAFLEELGAIKSLWARSLDLPLQGGSFAWRGGLNNQSQLRLDRFLVSEDWECYFSGIAQCLLHRLVYDHFPIVLNGGGLRKGPSPFKFENIFVKGEALKAKLKASNKEVFAGATTRKDLSLNQMMFWDAIEGTRGEWRPSYNELSVEALEGEDAMMLEVSFFEEEKGGDEDLKDFRPINLVSSLYKLLANRLKKVVIKVVSNSQSAFVKGRQILNASLIANEAIDSVQEGNDGAWGLRYGDPFSPYLFVIVIEALNYLLKRAKEGGFLPGWKIRGRGREGVEVSHLLFVDDTLVLCLPVQMELAFYSGRGRLFGGKSLVVSMGKKRKGGAPMKLQGRRMCRDVDYQVVWTKSKDSKFTVKSLYKALEPEKQSDFLATVIWNSWVLPRVGFFAWEATWNKFLTLDRIQRDGGPWLIDATCVFQRKSHLIAFFCIARILRHLLFALFEMSWVLPFSIRETLLGWHGSFVFKGLKFLSFVTFRRGLRSGTATCHTIKLLTGKGHQGWMKEEGMYFIFPGGGTMFPDGAEQYIEKLSQYIPLTGGVLRTALDMGCGVASFGGYLLNQGILTFSFAPRDSHKSQIQFALERGIPALVAMLGTRRLPFPAFSFDLVHCSRCLIPFTAYNATYFLEVDRLLRPGGYLVISGPPVLWPKLDKEWADLQAVARALCYELKAVDGNTAIWKKPAGDSCLPTKMIWPKNLEYFKLKKCVTRISSVKDDQVVGMIPNWPDRLTKAPSRATLLKNGIDVFEADTRRWARRVAYYKNSLNLKLGTAAIRNVMDMNAFFGGFAAALTSDPVWVMNVVPPRKPSTLGVIYDRGLIGVYHDWCEPFSTYPRTYDLIHVTSIESLIKILGSGKNRCNLVDLMVEMDRILRPEGTVVIRDSPEVIDKIGRIAQAVRWTATIHEKEPESHGREKILVATKNFWKLPSASH